MNNYSMKDMEGYLGVSMARQKIICKKNKIRYQYDVLRDTGKKYVGYKHKDFWHLVKALGYVTITHRGQERIVRQKEIKTKPV